MRIHTFRSVLDECLESVRRGESVEACLKRYPRHAERLRPLLELASNVGSAPPAQPRPWAQAATWDAFRQRAQELRGGKRRGGGIGFSFGMWLRPVAIAVVLVMAVMAGGGATAYASQDALPDSPLYRVKLLTEDVHLWFVFDDANEAELLLDQSDERMDEIMAMARKGKPIPGSVFSAMENRHSRATEIVDGLEPANEDRDRLLTRLLDQSAAQEESLLALWDAVSPDGRQDYAEVVALIHNTRLQGSTSLVLSPDDIIGGIRQIEGEVQQVSDGVWSIGGIQVEVDERTIGARELQQGTTAAGVFARSVTGDLKALSLISTGSPPSFVSGEIEEVSDDGVVVAGQFIRFDPKTIVPEDLKLGDRVDLEVSRSDEGTLATSVHPAAAGSGNEGQTAFTFVGTIEGEVNSEGEWLISGVRFASPDNLKIHAGAGNAEPGVRALVEGSYEDGRLVANSITVLNGTASSDSVYLVGTYGGLSAGQWFISGIGLNPRANADEPPQGSIVSVDALRVGDQLSIQESAVLEEPDEEPLIRVMGTIQEINGTAWDVGIGLVRVNPSAQVSGEPEEGARVLMWGRKSNVDVFQAVYVRVLDMPVSADD